MADALAFKMRIELAQLARRHGVVSPSPRLLPLQAPTDGPMLLSVALRAAARNYRRGQLIRLASQCGISDEAVFQFSPGVTSLSPAVLQRLAGLVSPGARSE